MPTLLRCDCYYAIRCSFLFNTCPNKLKQATVISSYHSTCDKVCIIQPLSTLPQPIMQRVQNSYKEAVKSLPIVQVEQSSTSDSFQRWQKNTKKVRAIDKW